MAQVNAGRVRFVGRGEYNNSTQYYVFDLVSYNGNSYYAKVDTIGNLPTNTTYWQLVAEKGNVGPTGLTGNGISSIEKTSTSGLVDTYTITFTNGNTTTFDVSNGNGIDRIEKTDTVGNIDTYTIYFTNGETTTYEVENGEVTKEELQEEVDRLNMVYNALPSTTGEAEEISIDGTAEVPFRKIDLKGNTYQETTTGKNLLLYPYPQTTKTVNGITFTDNGDGSITMNGTATANAPFTLFASYQNQDTIPGNYIYGGLNSNVRVRAINYSGEKYHIIGNSEGTSVAINKSTYTQGYIELSVLSGTTVNNLVVKPMVTINEDNTYEPYTNGASPNPDYPQDIQVVSGDNTVVVCGKNLLKIVDGTYSSSGITAIANNEEITLNGTATNNAFISFIIDLKKNDIVSYSANNNETNSNVALRFFRNSTSGTYGAASLNVINKVNENITLNQDYDRFQIRVASGTTLSNFKLKPMIVKGTTVGTYEQYIGKSYPIQLGNIELCKIGDYQDSIVKDNGKWCLNKQIGKVVLDGSEVVDSFSVTGGNLFRFQNIAVSVSNISPFSNYFIGVSNNLSRYDGTVYYNYGAAQSRMVFDILTTKFTTVAEFKSWLSTHNTIVYYALATPTITEITDTTLIEQLDNLENAYSYDTQTNITQTNDDMPFILDVEAIMSLKNIFNS